jgi:phosphomannomutase
MIIKPGIFHDYDVRARIPDELDKEGAIRLGQVLVELFKPKTVAIGHDMRISADDIAGGIATGVISQGADVVDLGLMSTDMAYFASGKYGYDLSLSVSASHNPAEYNGFKIVKKGAIAISGRSGIYDIRDKAISSDIIQPASIKGTITKRDILDDFIKHCLTFIDTKNIKPFRIVIDAGNGIAGLLIPALQKFLPLQITPLFFELDGRFPNHVPNPLIPENNRFLETKIKETKADFGITFDGDGDRMYFLDENSRFVTGTITTALIAEAVLKKNPNSTILYNAVTGRIVPEIIQKLGGKPVRVRVGHTLIKEDMRTFNAIFAGEHSGHYYFKDNYSADSGIIAMLLALEAVSNKNKKLSDIVAEFDKYPSIPETNFEVKDQQAVMKQIEKNYSSKAQKIDWLDGVTIWFEDYWANIRPSNTQPLLRLNIEADNMELLESKKKEYVDLIISLGGILSHE